MHEKTAKIQTPLLMALAACLAVAGFVVGRAVEHGIAEQERESLCALNRESIEKLVVEDGPIYVIGHRSPDSDTVCAAIAYARFLTLVGFDAQAAITEPVNHETAFILREAGVETPPVLEDASGKDVFLVDHSEYAQAAEGMADAHVVGILDHHGAGNVTTGHQLLYEAKPIGSTSTIVWLDYLNYGFEIDQATARLLLGAVLSDTDGLTGSTVTGADRQAVGDLAGIAGVDDVDGLYHDIHVEKLSYEGMTDEEILFSDYKEYEAGGTTFGIGLVNAIDEDVARELAERVSEAMPAGFESKSVDLMYACVGIRENGEKIDRIVAADEHSREVFEAAFPDFDEYDGTSFVFRGGLGRKTKFVPGLTEFLNARPHE